MTTSTLDPLTTATQLEPVVATKPRRLAPIVLGVLGTLALGTALSAFALGRGKESTDDAQIEGHVASVSPRVNGQVLRVLVKDNELVKAGDTLVELDDRELSTKVAAARADLAAANAQERAMETTLRVTEKSVDSNLVVAHGGLAQASAVRGNTHASIDQAQAAVTAAESRSALAASEFERSARLLSDGAISQAEYDTKKAARDQAAAFLLQSRAQLTAAQANLENSSGTLESARGRLIAAESGPAQVEAAKAQVELAQARVEQAKAALDQVELSLSYTKVKAESAGVVSRRSVEVGQMVSPDRPLMAIVPLDDTWVVANFKEDQIAEMRSGAAAWVTIDAFSGRKLSGRVDSLSGGTGARFSLLPPDNASGNFTKVVQRVPVLIRLDPHPEVELRPGLSAAVTVFTH